MTTADGRQTRAADGRAEAQRRHGGRVSEQARVRQAQEAVEVELPLLPPVRGFDVDDLTGAELKQHLRRAADHRVPWVR